MQRFAFTVAYDGTSYEGFQLQTRSSSEASTIQGELEKALAIIAGKRIVVNASGRTDSGVHSIGQVCHCDLPLSLKNINLELAINSILPGDIKISNVRHVARSFHARYNAISKTYYYMLVQSDNNSNISLNPMFWRFSWPVFKINIETMQEAIPFLVGSKDFASFQNSRSGSKDTVRDLYSIEIKENMVGDIVCPSNYKAITIWFKGSGFLKQMVRNMVGLLVFVGQGKIKLSSLPGIIEQKKRSALSSPTAPAKGLCLYEVGY